MVLQVAADLGQIDHRRDTVVSQMIAVANTRQHEDLRRIDRPGREHYLARRIGRNHPSALAVDDTFGAPLGDGDALGKSPGLHRQIGPR